MFDNMPYSMDAWTMHIPVFVSPATCLCISTVLFGRMTLSIEKTHVRGVGPSRLSWKPYNSLDTLFFACLPELQINVKDHWILYVWTYVYHLNFIVTNCLCYLLSDKLPNCRSAATVEKKITLRIPYTKYFIIISKT